MSEKQSIQTFMEVRLMWGEVIKCDKYFFQVLLNQYQRKCDYFEWMLFFKT